MLLSKSPTINIALQSIGIITPFDVVNHLPRRYDSFLYTPKKNRYLDKERVVKKGYVRQKGRSLRFAKRTLTSFYFETSEGETFLVEAWNRPYLATSLKMDTLLTISGVYEEKRHAISLINILVGEISEENALRPIYALPSQVPNHSFAHLVKKCLTLLEGKIEEVVPSYFREKYRLLSHEEALRKAHLPVSTKDLYLSKRTLKYEEALSFSVKSALLRKMSKERKKDEHRKINVEKVKDFVHSLPYSLSIDQEKALQEIYCDMDSSNSMYRLLQGDVGTGKTLVAALSAYANFSRGEQTAILAPTDALAKQHYDNLKRLFSGTKVEITLLTGSLSSEEKERAYDDIFSGTSDIIVGTHALFSRGVNYAYLGLVIIDEQHKFGVNQRAALLEKGKHADLLLMSATPIPRTLALTVYGDLDVSTLTSFPSGKRNVKTLLLQENDKQIKKSIDASLKEGHRVYIVAPHIDSDKDDSVSALHVASIYQKLYPGKVTLMHGKLDEEHKESAIMAFKSGLCPILVATSLIEVGIDVKEANLMIIYHASSFSLSSLHQLRGRVGRGGDESKCLLLFQKGDEADNEKLRVLERTDDGFKIAEEDMRLRGPGEMAGTKQSGLPTFAVASIIDDFKMFEVARDDATYMLTHSTEPEFSSYLKRIKKNEGDISLA